MCKKLHLGILLAINNVLTKLKSNSTTNFKRTTALDNFEIT